MVHGDEMICRSTVGGFIARSIHCSAGGHGASTANGAPFAFRSCGVSLSALPFFGRVPGTAQMAMIVPSETNEAEDAARVPEVMYRHSLLVRLTHWINVLCLALLLMSGLKIFNYHPALYWGHYGYHGVPPVFSITA